MVATIKAKKLVLGDQILERQDHNKTGGTIINRGIVRALSRSPDMSKTYIRVQPILNDEPLDWEYGSQDPVLILRLGPPPSEAP